ncbi:MAG: thioredoxin-disulfide reductase [bacterium]
MKAWDVVIIGAGPAGLSAGIYAARNRLKTLICEKAAPGGLANMTERIENFPGFPDGISGLELCALMLKQAENFGAVIEMKEATRISRQDKKIVLEVGGSEIESLTSIVATGSIPKRLGVVGEERLVGKGLSYCATCDAPLFTDKIVAVIGGGDSAFQEAVFIARFAKKVKIIHRREKFRATAVLQERVKNLPNVELVKNVSVEKITGDDEVTGVLVKDNLSGKRYLVEANGVFIYAGYSPVTDFLGEEFKRTSDGFLIVEENLQTSVQGVFAAGDVRQKLLRQVVTAAADGALAAFSASNYIENH